MSTNGTPEGFDLRRGLGSRVRLNDGHAMPVLGLGVWQLGPGASTRDAVRAALGAGYRLFDTAKLYGNERDVGAALRDSGVPREELFVTTKLWNDDQGYESALKAFARSERDLGLGPVDLYLIHWPVTGRRADSWRALRELRDAGRVRSIGVSNYTVRHLMELLATSDIVPAVNQVEFSPFLYQRDLLEYCRDHRIQLEAYAPLTRGAQFRDPTVAAIAAAHGKSPAQVMLRWGLEHGVIEIPKSARPERIRENAAVFDFALTADERARLDALDEAFRTTWDPTSIP